MQNLKPQCNLIQIEKPKAALTVFTAPLPQNIPSPTTIINTAFYVTQLIN